MSYSINASGHGPADDDLRAAFGELVRSLRSVTPEGQTFYAALSTGAADYNAADIPDDEPADDEGDDDAAGS